MEVTKEDILNINLALSHYRLYVYNELQRLKIDSPIEYNKLLEHYHSLQDTIEVFKYE